MGGVELPSFLIPDSHSLLDLGSGMSCHPREGDESTTLPFGSPTRPAEGPHPPLRQHKPFSPPNTSSQGREVAVPSFLGRDTELTQHGCRHPPDPRSPHRWGHRAGGLPAPSWGVIASILT